MSRVLKKESGGDGLFDRRSTNFCTFSCLTCSNERRGEQPLPDECLAFGKEKYISQPHPLLSGAAVDLVGFTSDANTYFESCEGERPLSTTPRRDDAIWGTGPRCRLIVSAFHLFSQAGW